MTAYPTTTPMMKQSPIAVSAFGEFLGNRYPFHSVNPSKRSASSSGRSSKEPQIVFELSRQPVATSIAKSVMISNEDPAERTGIHYPVDLTYPSVRAMGLPKSTHATSIFGSFSARRAPAADRTGGPDRTSFEITRDESACSTRPW